LRTVGLEPAWGPFWRLGRVPFWVVLSIPLLSRLRAVVLGARSSLGTRLGAAGVGAAERQERCEGFCRCRVGGTLSIRVDHSGRRACTGTSRCGQSGRSGRMERICLRRARHSRSRASRRPPL
jgi:hypothetical protein